MTHLYQHHIQVQGRLIRLLFVTVFFLTIIIGALFEEMRIAHETTAQVMEMQRVSGGEILPDKAERRR